MLEKNFGPLKFAQNLLYRHYSSSFAVKNSAISVCSKAKQMPKSSQNNDRQVRLQSPQPIDEF